MSSTRLIADIGGTNSRLGLSAGGAVIDGSTRHFRNDDWPDFNGLLGEFLGDAPVPDEAVLAVAGTKTHDHIRLTNRPWRIDMAELKTRFGFRRIELLNDLEALGHALPVLGGRLSEVLPGPSGGRQRLVVGIGTGFNVCAVTRSPAGLAVTLSAEFGHVPLPSDIALLLRREAGIGDDLTVEDVFSGRGYLRVLRAVAGHDFAGHGEAAEWTAAASEDAARFLGFYGTCLGLLLRTLTLTFLPMGGIHLAGSVARAVAGSSAIGAVAEVCRLPYRLEDVSTPAIRLVADDDAALLGCATIRLGG